MKSVHLFLAGMVLICAVSCNPPEEWHDKYDDIVPGPVTNVNVENLNGAASISYDHPSVQDGNLLGVKAVYSHTVGGEEVVRWSSANRDTIVLEGFGDTNERIVNLYAVHKNGNVSEPVSTTIQPKTPPIFLMRESMQVQSTFGGVQINWKNPTKLRMGIAFYTEDSITHEMVLYDKFFSSLVDGKTAFRPFDAVEQNFRIELFDKWQNYAPPLDTALIPWKEVEILGMGDNDYPIWSLVDGESMGENTTTLQRYMYRCDSHFYWSGLSFRIACIPDVSSYWYVRSNQTISIPFFPDMDLNQQTIPLPMYFTIDMGKKASYSRLNIRFQNRAPIFSFGVFTDFAVWGANSIKAIEDVEDPHGIYPKGSREANQAYWSAWKIPGIVNGTDAWKNEGEGWTKILTGKYATDAGDIRYYTDMPLTADDVAKYSMDGYDFDFDEVVESYRYLRFEVIENCEHWNGWTGLHYIRFWGNYAEEE